jgi:hypothetical protein
MRRILLLLSVALVMAAIMATSALPAFAQGPEGGNPEQGLCPETNFGRTVGAQDIQPLPFGGTEPEAAFNAAGPAVGLTAPGSPFNVNRPAQCLASL